MHCTQVCVILDSSVLNEITFNSSRAESGSITGLNEREWGQIGVKSMQGTFGCTCKIEKYRLKDA